MDDHGDDRQTSAPASSADATRGAAAAARTAQVRGENQDASRARAELLVSQSRDRTDRTRGHRDAVQARRERSPRQA